MEYPTETIEEQEGRLKKLIPDGVVNLDSLGI
jgi:hypothetical protein